MMKKILAIALCAIVLAMCLVVPSFAVNENFYHDITTSGSPINSAIVTEGVNYTIRVPYDKFNFYLEVVGEYDSEETVFKADGGYDGGFAEYYLINMYLPATVYDSEGSPMGGFNWQFSIQIWDAEENMQKVVALVYDGTDWIVSGEALTPNVSENYFYDVKDLRLEFADVTDVDTAKICYFFDTVLDGTATYTDNSPEPQTPAKLIGAMFDGFGVVIGNIGSAMKTAFVNIVYVNPNVANPTFSPLVLFIFCMAGLSIATGIVYGIFKLVGRKK